METSETTTMKGLDLCQTYFYEEGEKAFRQHFGMLYERMALGLVGDGSECYGYDDAISRDYDWGPGFCVWLNAKDHAAFGAKARQIYDGLPVTFRGYPQRKTSRRGEGRIGVMEISAFYRNFIGDFQPPSTIDEWLMLSESALAAATNGRVFRDPSGEFSKIRQSLLEFYPEDVRLKKIAARCMSTGREGQYNFPRSLKRREFYAAHYAETKFCADALSLVFLLNKRYAPFYKWTHRAVLELPVLGGEFFDAVSGLLKEQRCEAKVTRIEAMAQALIRELQRQGLSDSSSDFLPDHGPVVQDHIRDKALRNSNVLID
jgi:hypothetical protein